MSDIFDKLLLAYIVLQVVTGIYRSLRGGEEASEEYAGQPELDGLPDETFHLMVQDSLAQLFKAQRDVEAPHTRIKPLIKARFPAGQVYDLLREHLQTEVSPQLQRIRTALDGAQEILETEGELAAASHLNRSDVIADTFQTLAQLWDTVGSVEGLLVHQQTRESRDLLRMAEEIGRDLVNAWQACITAPRTGAEPPKVVALVAPTDDVDLPKGILPNHLLVTVPLDALAEPQSWLRVVQSTAKAFLNHHPALSSQLSGAIQSTGPAWLPRRQGRQIVVDLRFDVRRLATNSTRCTRYARSRSRVCSWPYRVLENPDNRSKVTDAPAPRMGRLLGTALPHTSGLCCVVRFSGYWIRT